jgi:hypothetical protein
MGIVVETAPGVTGPALATAKPAAISDASIAVENWTMVPDRYPA